MRYYIIIIYVTTPSLNQVVSANLPGFYFRLILFSSLVYLSDGFPELMIRQ